MNYAHDKCDTWHPVTSHAIFLPMYNSINSLERKLLEQEAHIILFWRGVFHQRLRTVHIKLARKNLGPCFLIKQQGCFPPHMYLINLFTFKGETKDFIPADPSYIASTKLLEQHTAFATCTTSCATWNMFFWQQPL